MADFTLNAPGTTANPYTPANIIIPDGTLQSDTVLGIWPGTGVYTAFAHNTTYGTVITVTATISVASGADHLTIGAVVRSGANAGAMIGVDFSFFDTAKVVSVDGAGAYTSVSSNSAAVVIATSVVSATVTISGGTATITSALNGTPITFDANTTTAFTGEASLAAGCAFDPQNSNLTRISQFTGTGVTGGGAVAFRNGLILLGIG